MVIISLPKLSDNGIIVKWHLSFYSRHFKCYATRVEFVIGCLSQFTGECGFTVKKFYATFLVFVGLRVK